MKNPELTERRRIMRLFTARIQEYLNSYKSFIKVLDYPCPLLYNTTIINLILIKLMTINDMIAARDREQIKCL